MIQKYAPTLSYTPMSALVQFHVVHSRKLVENNWHTEQKTYNTLHKTYTYKVITSKNKKIIKDMPLIHLCGIFYRIQNYDNCVTEELVTHDYPWVYRH